MIGNHLNIHIEEIPYPRNICIVECYTATKKRRPFCMYNGKDVKGIFLSNKSKGKTVCIEYYHLYFLEKERRGKIKIFAYAYKKYLW